MELDKLTLVSGGEIFIPSLRVNIHQPTIKEIAIIGEENFYKYLSIFNVTVESVLAAMTAKAELEKDSEITLELVKNTLGNMSDFEVIMQMIQEDQDTRLGFETILMILMPEHSSFSYEERFIMCLSSKAENVIIDIANFNDLRDVVKTIFCLDVKAKEEFNPQGDKAKSIAEKIKKGRNKVRESQGLTQEKTYILANYISALSIGSNAYNINQIIDLTVYQLFNQMERFGLYTQHDCAVKAAMAGAKDVEMVDWLKTL